jgi:hypothetical protein
MSDQYWLSEVQLKRVPPIGKISRECRCLIPADGFYEWTKVPGGNIPTVSVCGSQQYCEAGRLVYTAKRSFQCSG